MIEKETVQYIADLARLELSENDKTLFTNELNAILEYVDQLNQVDTKNVEPTAFVVATHDPLRDDIPRECLDLEQTLQNGPVVKKGFFAVPKVIAQS